MNPIFLATYVILWIFVTILVVLVLLLYRHFGRALLPPVERMQLSGLDIGATAPEVAVVERAGEQPTLLVPETDDAQFQFLLFASSTCPICDQLWETVDHMPVATPSCRFIWIGNDLRRARPPAGWRVVAGADSSAHDRFEVPALPYAYVLDPHRHVSAKGLINNVDDAAELLRRAGARMPQLLTVAPNGKGLHGIDS